MEVFRPGTPVLIGDDVPAVVNKIHIEGESMAITYMVVWWGGHDGRERHESWLQAHEVRFGKETETTELGFHKCELG